MMLASRFFICLSALILFISTLKAEVPADSVYWTNAQTVQKCIAHTLLTGFDSYRTKIDATNSFAWYDVSHIYADAAMVAHGDSNYVSSMNSAFFWMEHLWDASNPNGGYFANIGIKGDGPGGGKYVDDNSLIGNVYLDCYNVSADSMIKTKYLAAAMAAADWLMHSGQWDDTRSVQIFEFAGKLLDNWEAKLTVPSTGDLAGKLR